VSVYDTDTDLTLVPKCVHDRETHPDPDRRERVVKRRLTMEAIVLLFRRE
jgi:hypothetical protein